MKKTGMHRLSGISITGATLDVPEAEPEDPKLQYDKFMQKIKGPVNFEKQRSKRTLLEEVVKPVNENRFKVIHDISDWNSKFQAKIAQPFSKGPRDTDIPGTVKNTNFQQNGRDYDIFIDCNTDVGKKSLTLGMVDLKKQFDHRSNLSKTNQIPGRNCWKGIGTLSDPWEYDPEAVWNG